MSSIHHWARWTVPALAAAVPLAAAGAGCGRDVSPAGVKQVGVGIEPGELQANPEPRGGLIDYVLLELRGKWLDLGSTITGLYGAGDAFTNGEDPFRTVMGFSYVFNPALTAADEVSLITPKGPDAVDSCYPLINNIGPLGSFTTVDLGDSMVIRDQETAGRQTRFSLDRNPLDYPTLTSDVFIYYIGSQAYLSRSHVDGDVLGWAQEHLVPNWEFDRPMDLVFGGGIPPENAPVAAIPLPSDAADGRVDKAAGNPGIVTPPELLALRVTNRLDDSGAAALEFDIASDGAPSPWGASGGDDVLHVLWDEAPDSGAIVTISIRLLGSVPGGAKVSCYDDPTKDCDCSDLGSDLAGNAVSDCDPDHATAAALAAGGLTEGGEDYLSGPYAPEDCTDPETGANLCNCSDGVDNDKDGGCDGGGCTDPVTGAFLPPDPDCPRPYPIAECVADPDGEASACQPTGGSRDYDGFVGELVCTAQDDGDFVVEADELASLVGRVDVDRVRGAILVVARTREELVQLPMVRNETGGSADINPVRLRASHMVVGRLAYETP